MAISKKMRKFSEKCKKMRMPFGSLPDTILETILGAFGVPLGSLGASLWEKMGFGKASKKWSEKRVCKEFGEFRGI